MVDEEDIKDPSLDPDILDSDQGEEVIDFQLSPQVLQGHPSP